MWREGAGGITRSRRAAAGAAVVVASLFFWWTFVRLHANPGTHALDFTYAWRAAGHLLAGRDPYSHMPAAPYTTGGLFLYPLTTAVVALPFARLPVALAGAAFFAVSVGLLVYGLLRSQPWRTLVLFSPAFVLAYYNVQWSPLIMAGAILPRLGWVVVAKPNIGIEAFAYRPRWSAIVAGAAFLLLSIMLDPAWPRGWLGHLGAQEAPHLPPAAWPLGVVGLVGLARWRTPEGRLLLAATLAPAMSLPYDHLLLWLVPRHWQEAAVLTFTAWVAYAAVLATAPHDLTTAPAFVQLLLVIGMYVPAAAFVLRYPNAAPAESVNQSPPTATHGSR
jgi:hypothetical protein